MDADSINPEASIEDEFWFGPSQVQVHAEMLGLSEEQFLIHYPVGKTFRMELTVRVLEESEHLELELTVHVPGQEASTAVPSYVSRRA